MSKLPDKSNGSLLLFFVKLHLVECFTNYDSFISDTCKIGLVHTLLFRFFKIFSSMEDFHIEVELLRGIFKYNNYPAYTIKFFDKLYIPKQILPTVPKKELLVVLPYLGTFSLNLRKRLYKSFGKSLPPQYNIKVIFQYKN